MENKVVKISDTNQTLILKVIWRNKSLLGTLHKLKAYTQYPPPPPRALQLAGYSVFLQDRHAVIFQLWAHYMFSANES